MGTPGTGGACLDGGGGACALPLYCGVVLGSTINSVGRAEGVRRCEAGLLLRSFMRLVERVRLNCAVRSWDQVSDSCCCGCGTGLRLGMPLLLSMVSLVCAVLLLECCEGASARVVVVE